MDEANGRKGNDAETTDDQENNDGPIDKRGTGDDASGDLGTGFAMPHAEANEEIAANATTLHGVPFVGSLARPLVSLTSGAEVTAPGAPLPPRRSARRAPRASVPAVAGTATDRGAGLRSGGGSNRPPSAERQGHSRRGAEEEAGGEQARSPRYTRVLERQSGASRRQEDAAQNAHQQRAVAAPVGHGRMAASEGRPRGGGPANVYQQAGRRALMNMIEDSNSSTSDSSFIPAESTDSSSSSESVDEALLQTPAGTARATPSHTAGGTSATHPRQR
ncbi:unnamed protein product [Closterium sp. Yama58-4]|nr:unnamed protein product [Closterium sp. Yama58-4]